MADPLSIVSLTFRYPGASRPALRDISFDVPSGTCCVVLGPTGSGKSTLLQGIAGVLDPHNKQAAASGSIRIGSVAYEPLPQSVLFPQVGLFLQDPMVQISGIRERVEEEVRFALDNLQVPDQEARLRVRMQLEELGLESLASRPLRHLSGGELQRVALAGVLVGSPSVLLLDEPLNSLDAPAQARLIRLLASFKGKKTVVLTDYGIEAALRVADQVIVLSEGSVLYHGSPAGLVRRAVEFADILPTEDLVSLFPLLAAGPEAFQDRRFFSRLLEVV